MHTHIYKHKQCVQNVLKYDILNVFHFQQRYCLRIAVTTDVK